MSRKYLLLKQKIFHANPDSCPDAVSAVLLFPGASGGSGYKDSADLETRRRRGLHGNGGEWPCQQHLNTLATLHTLNTHQTRGDTALCT